MSLFGAIIWVCFPQGRSLSQASGKGTDRVARAKNDGNPEVRLDAVLRLLVSAPSGKELFKEAERQWEGKEGAASFIQWSDSSRTDALITRHFNPRTGKERREKKVVIYLKRDQDLDALVLDLTHELVHATARAEWDPYDPELTPEIYVRTAIEGHGGEVDAVVKECQVSLELGAGEGVIAERCKGYLDAGTHQPSRARVLRDFYKIGKWAEEFVARLGAGALGFPWLSSEKPRLYSSTGHMPYPVALLHEYDGITEVACENSRKRVNHSSRMDQSSSLFMLRRCQAS